MAGPGLAAHEFVARVATRMPPLDRQQMQLSGLHTYALQIREAGLHPVYGPIAADY
ncbi:hypothetical protein GCM10009304_05100 [Pseudomonas matsuisoli]|uniref:Uncharacterized protein n=1 Tax=Pseudomonas matsuisoli TaxID=1515666 RepID=A0A917USI4_9PSED|nr:hypothetical protein GCM10009304_05100 [Pseudomonas matsuisoli]